MKRLRWPFLVGILVVSGVFGYLLRDVIYQVVVVPIAYFLWVLNFYYSALPQWLVWVIVVSVLFLAMVWNLIPDVRPSNRKEIVHHRTQGEVEALAVWIGKAQQGNYFRWQLANRMGRIARRLDELAGSGGRRSSPDADVEQYIDAGLNYSFVDFPTARNPLAPVRHTPLDLDPHKAADYLESQMENTSERSR
jgi:hypothetical protein